MTNLKNLVAWLNKQQFFTDAVIIFMVVCPITIYFVLGVAWLLTR